ncbi:MAG: flavin reductase [Tannerella sp.]|jgi:flavin reductase (DIM6/NTAB) family NADH-FMN oxidoreductase RutF|nr:flavin reductase [Tannerella sp.]
MKHIVFISLFVAAFVFTGCNESSRQTDTGQQENTTVTLTREQIQASSFNELFKQITPQEISEDVFTLVNKDLTILTGGTPKLYNSMVASWGGWGTLFDKPVTWCFLRSNRYTLELIKKDLTYTMSYFDDEYKEDLMKFGTQSGRDGKKMEETKLTAVQSPAGNMTFKEAKLIIECKLFEITSVSPDDFQTDDARKFVVDAYAETNEYHKIVFGEITNVWIRK